MTSSRLAHDVQGPDDAPVVVLGSSLGTDRTMWDEVVPRLVRDLRVVRYDHLGHGRSPVPPGPYRVEDLAAELLALLDDLGVARAHLAGVSLGGMVALRLAADAPERVDRLALVCSSAHVPPASTWLERAATVRREGMEAVAEAVALRWFTPAFATTERAEQLRAGLRSVPAEGYAACCEALAQLDLRSALADVTAPTLVVAGGQDAATPPSHGQRIVDGLGGPARLEVVEPAAHLGSVEQGARVTELLLRHFAEAEQEEDARG